GSPSGWPRWLMRIRAAPAPDSWRSVGRAPTMRRSLLTLPCSSSGTLKSTRTRTRLPVRSPRSSMVFLAMACSSRSDVEIEGELIGMGPQAQGLDLLLALVPDPGVDDVVGEDLALEQELVVASEHLQGVLQRVRRLGHLAQFLRLQIVDV